MVIVNTDRDIENIKSRFIIDFDEVLMKDMYVKYVLTYAVNDRNTLLANIIVRALSVDITQTKPISKPNNERDFEAIVCYSKKQ
jgi:hypothetical protein